LVDGGDRGGGEMMVVELGAVWVALVPSPRRAVVYCGRWRGYVKVRICGLSWGWRR
jgi:hypothetical protein